MTGEAGHHNLGDQGMALASSCRLLRYFPEATLVATGLDPLGAVLRHQAKIVPWPLVPHGLQTTYPQRLLQKIARKLGASPDFMDPTGRSFARIFEEQYRCNAVFRNVVAEIERADFVFDMGHGALNDVFNPFMICFVYYLAGRFEKPLFISGQTLGPIWRPQSSRMLRDSLMHAHTLGLRDEVVSRQVLTDDIGFASGDTRVIEVGDDTLDLDPLEPDLEKLTPDLRALLEDRSFFAVQFRMSDYSAFLSDSEPLQSFVRAIRLLHKESGLQPLFVPLSWESRSSDILAAARVSDLLQSEIPFYVLWPYLQAAEIKWVLSRAQFGLGISYHFHVFLLSQGIPSVAFYSNSYYEVKLKGVFAAYDYRSEPFRYPFRDFETEHFKETLDTVSNWTDEDGKRLRSKAASLSNKWHEAFRRFVEESRLVNVGN